MRFFSQVLLGCPLMLWGGGCATHEPVLEMALADAALRQARYQGLEQKQPEAFNRAFHLYHQAEFHLKKQEYGQAKSYAVEVRHIVERAELSVLESEGVASIPEEGATQRKEGKSRAEPF